MSESVIIIGASGHGKVIADIVIKSGDKVVGFLDDNIEKGTLVSGIEVLGSVPDYAKWKDCSFVIGIGNPYTREKIHDRMLVNWYTAIHPTAVISSLDVEIGDGTVVMANAVINSNAKIGKHCIINTASVVEHDNVLGDYVHLSPNVALAGNVKIGKNTHIGIGSQVIQGITVASDVTIGAGATVVRNIDEKGTYVGIPTKKIK